MKAALLIGQQSNQRALANKLARVVDLVGIVVSENVPKRKKPLPEQAELFARRVECRLVGRPFIFAWFGMLRHYDELFPRLPETRVVRVENVNDAGTLDLLEETQPDVVFVSGTNLVGKKIVEYGRRGKGVINLHTGISPYVKGGPNCTNWCLAEGWFHLIGSTMMWIDLGIDTGDLIMTERTPLDGGESLDELHLKVMDHGHDMYVRTAAALSNGKPLPRIKQASIAEGTTFYTRQWETRANLRARMNFRRKYAAAFRSGQAAARAEDLQLVSLASEVAQGYETAR